MTLFNNLVQLAEATDKHDFFFRDYQKDDKTYRVFSYQLVNWASFQQTDAHLCRGTTFDITNLSQPRLVALPPDKFFNYNEGKQDHSQSRCIACYEKLDGSLVSSYIHKDELQLKSKDSIIGNLPNIAMQWLRQPKNSDYLEFVETLTRDGNTVNFEWVSPHNHIVVPYPDERLVLLNYRNLDSRRVFYFDSSTQFPAAKRYEIDDTISLDELVTQKYHDMSGEGCVLLLEDTNGMQYSIKVKTHQYAKLHGLRDSINNKVALAEIILQGKADDLRAEFADDAMLLQLLGDMESHMMPIYNAIVHDIRQFYHDHQSLQRKDYAIKAKAELGNTMSLAMSEYNGRRANYVAYSIKHLKELYGIFST